MLTLHGPLGDGSWFESLLTDQAPTQHNLMAPEHEHGCRWRRRQQHVAAPGQLLLLVFAELIRHQKSLFPLQRNFLC